MLTHVGGVVHSMKLSDLISQWRVKKLNLLSDDGTLGRIRPFQSVYIYQRKMPTPYLASITHRTGSCTGRLDGALTFLRYIYGMDLSHITESWNWTSQSAIAQFSGAVQNLGPDIFSFDATLFQPGARIILKIMMGNSQPYPIGVAWLDECNYDIASETVDISGRNSIGYFLKDQTFDDETVWEDGASATVEAILTYAGLKKVQHKL